MSERFKDWKPPHFDSSGITKWGWKCLYHENLQLGKNTDIGAFCLINAKYGVIIEDGVQIGGGVKIYSDDTIGDNQGAVILRKNCKIGANSVIMPNLTIGEGTIVGALSFVYFSLPASVLAGGCPIKIIRSLD